MPGQWVGSEDSRVFRFVYELLRHRQWNPEEVSYRYSNDSYDLILSREAEDYKETYLVRVFKYGKSVRQVPVRRPGTMPQDLCLLCFNQDGCRKGKNIGLDLLKSVAILSKSEGYGKVTVVGPNMTHHAKKYIQRHNLNIEHFSFSATQFVRQTRHNYQPFLMRKLEPRVRGFYDIPDTSSFQQYDHRDRLIQFLGYKKGDLLLHEYRNHTTCLGQEYGVVV